MQKGLQLADTFADFFGKIPTKSFFAPGRVNLIGEHIDYNGGSVMPCAITFGTLLLTAPNSENVFRFRSLNFPETSEIEISSSYSKTGSEWYNYPLGVIHYFLKAGIRVEGLDLLYSGNVPIGSGLSSSASIEVVTAYALNEIFQARFSKLDLVRLSKRVENEFIGLNSGVMDQFAVTFGEEGKAIKLDCGTLDYDVVDCDLQDYVLAIINTNKSRKLAESKYNERVRECQIALHSLQQKLEISNLCGIDAGTLSKYEYLIKDELIRKRARHVIEENDRVLLAAKALAENQLLAFGKLMYASHRSLSELYEVSGEELDTVIEFCATRADVAGARMTGAGFGGCAIAIVKASSFDEFSTKMIAFYTGKIGYPPIVYQSGIGHGAEAR